MREWTDDAGLARQFAAHAQAALSRAPLNAAICDIVGGDMRLRRLLRHAPHEQRLPVLLLAAVHFLVLGEPDEPLAAWYPTVVDSPRDPFDPELEPTLVSFLGEHHDAIASLVSSRHVQTNEVGRGALFVPSLAAVAAERGRPIAHLDVGTSAGLNLLLPRLRITYVTESGDEHVVGDGPLELTCGVRGELGVPPPTRPPPIARSIGVDPRPIDLDDVDERRWLAACCWPDERLRFERLCAAIELARSTDLDVRGGTTADLVGLIDELPADEHPVVTTSWVMNYMSSADRRTWLEDLDTIGAARDLDWVFAESPALTPELPHPSDLAGDHVTAVVHVAWRAGARTTTPVARAHPHGHWIHGLP
ncbi:MAG: DUF2332 domain-containing protein [Actinomycetota bacterium]